MKKIISIALTVLLCLSLTVLGFVLCPPNLSEMQKNTLTILTCIAACSALYCFIAGELSGNTSQMDKLWSVLPVIYLWIITVQSGFKARLIVMAVLVTFWGIRLTYNFAKKGAYTLKFWAGKEDYRWEVLRKTKPFDNQFVWAVFNLGFISFYQNLLVLAICLPAIALMETEKSFCGFDILPALMMLGFFLLELIADHQQRNFYKVRSELTKDGTALADIRAPYNKGFNTAGLWKYSRHPNYLGEQGFWISLYLFTVSGGITKDFLFHWSIAGCMFLVLLFLGSSAMSEGISASKYPQYRDYQKNTSKFFLWFSK